MEDLQKRKEESLKNLDKITLEATDSRGFMLFTGIITNEKNADGNYMIKFYYDRCHYGKEDIAKFMKALKKHVDHDVYDGGQL